MCFSVIAGKNATVTGSVILGANDDWPGCPGQVHHVKSNKWKSSDNFISVKGEKIPQPPVTYAYTFTSAAYETGTFPVSWADGMNENQVAVSMQGVYAFRNLQNEGDVLEADDLSVLIMQRGESARQSIKMIGELIEKYGFSVSSIEGAEGTACLAIADAEEGFFFEIVPGGYWAARKVDDSSLECRPNCFGITNLDFDDGENFLYSSNLKEYVKEHGLWKEGEKLNFSAVFGQGKSVNEVYGGNQNIVNQLRRWRAVQLADGRDQNLEEENYSAVVQEKISAQRMMNLLRDSLEETKYDLTSAPEAGRYKNPFWMETSTSIGQGGTVVAMVAEFRKELPGAIGGRLWIGYANTHLAAFVPTYIASQGLPKEYQIGELGEYNLDSAWWAFQETGELCYRNYQEIAKKLVIPSYRVLEEKFQILCDEQEKKYQENGILDCDSFREITDQCAKEAYVMAKELGKKIKGKYLCNTILDWI